MDYHDILYDCADAIATITLHRPKTLNAYTPRMGEELEHALIRANADPEVRAIILTGSGRAFCAGADMSAGEGAIASAIEGGGDDASTDLGFIHALYDSLKPVIAAFNGPAIGIGITLALPADIRIASTTAKFGFVFPRLGVVMEAASAWFLPRIVGLAQAQLWCLTGRTFGADEALAGGLISEVIPPEDLLSRAKEIATDIARTTSPVSIALTRRLLWDFGSQTDYRTLMKTDAQLTGHLGKSSDVREGIAALLEKRQPNFTGRVPDDMPPPYPWRR